MYCRSLVNDLTDHRKRLETVKTELEFEDFKREFKTIENQCNEQKRELNFLVRGSTKSELRMRKQNILQDIHEMRNEIKKVEIRMNKKFHVQRARSRLLGDSGIRKRTATLADKLQQLDRVDRDLNESIEKASTVTNMLNDQHDVLMGAFRKLGLTSEALGISNSVVRVIGRREAVDRILVYAAMCLTLLLIFGLWYFFS